jgi:hypothetical protein
MLEEQSYEEPSQLYDYNAINNIREQIEQMTKFNQIEILRLLTKHDDIIINENKYGIHINLREIRPVILTGLCNYIKYINAQEHDLNSMENEKENYKKTFFIKDNKDKTTNTSKYVSQI